MGMFTSKVPLMALMADASCLGAGAAMRLGTDASAQFHKLRGTATQVRHRPGSHTTSLHGKLC